MDINDLRSITTIVMLALFVGIVWWAYSARHKKAFEEAANLPFDEDTPLVGDGERGAGQLKK